MAKLQLLAGTTSKSVGVFIQDSTSTTGAGLTGLAYNTASLIAYWYQAGVSAPAAIPLATLASATASYSSGGFFELDATHTPGHYRLDIPNAVLTGATSAVVVLRGATNMAQLQLEIELTAWNNQDAVHGGLSALPNAAANANGGLPILSSSGTTLAYTISTLTTYTGNTVQTGDSYARIGAAGGGLTAVGLTGTQTFNNTGTWTGNIVGTVSTLTTYTGNTPQTGDAYARIGSTGSGLTSLAPSATALSTAVWTAPPTGFLAATFPATVGSSTLTQTQVSGGAYAINSSSFAFNSGLDFTTTQKAATLARVTLADTITTYTGNTPQTGDSYARIGANGASLTALATATALSTAQGTLTKQETFIQSDGGAGYQFTTTGLALAPTGGNAPTADQNAAALLKLDWTGVSGEADYSVLQALRFLRCVWNTTETPGTLTVKKEDGTTTAWSRPIDTDASAIPITGVE